MMIRKGKNRSDYLYSKCFVSKIKHQSKKGRGRHETRLDNEVGARSCKRTSQALLDNILNWSSMDEPQMGCRLASGSGDGEGKREKPSILKCSDSFTLLLDPKLAPYPILMQTEFQQLWAGSKRQGSRMCM